MEATQGRPPSYSMAATATPETIAWPSVPQHGPDQPLPPTELTLPDLKTVLSPDFQRQSSPSQNSIASHQHHRLGSPTSVRSLPPIDPGYAAMAESPHTMDMTVMSPRETGSIASTDDRTIRSTSISMDDPDVRIAAEALSGLGNPDFARQPKNNETHVSSHASPTRRTRGAEPEPLLELVSQVHPWVGGTIKGSLSAYSTTKCYSPRIIRYGVNLVERNVGTPIVNVVGSVSAMTGIETGLRRHLDARRTGDLEQGRDKSTEMMDSSMDIDTPETIRHGRDMIREQLPPYRASRPPSYREETSPASLAERSRPSAKRTWSSQIFVTTSGLSVALSTTSRQSLRYCLHLLAQQIGTVSELTQALSLALKDYEETRHQYHLNNDAQLEKGERPQTPDQDARARRLAEHIRQISSNIMHSLRTAVNTVSSYTGGALPQNAQDFVRAQLLSLPQRWHVVSEQRSTDSETSQMAQRMVDFAGQGLDMLTEVSGVLKATLESAERWLASVGRRDQDDETMQDAGTQQYGLEKA